MEHFYCKVFVHNLVCSRVNVPMSKAFFKSSLYTAHLLAGKGNWWEMDVNEGKGWQVFPINSNLGMNGVLTTFVPNLRTPEARWCYGCWQDTIVFFSINWRLLIFSYLIFKFFIQFITLNESSETTFYSLGKVRRVPKRKGTSIQISRALK